jgi:hypothetical protein
LVLFWCLLFKESAPNKKAILGVLEVIKCSSDYTPPNCLLLRISVKFYHSVVFMPS